MNNLIAKANSPTEMRDIAARICRDYLTGAWKTISADELQLKRISGGLSNFLYYVSLPEHHYYNAAGVKSNEGSRRSSFNASSGTALEDIPKANTRSKGRNGNKRARKDSCANMLEPKEVLLRIYGQTHGEHALETMLTESVVFTLLSERKLGPKLHGIFPGGRIEQYIPARALLTAELSDMKISLKIAEKMAAIHSMDIPVSKEPDWIWNTMNRWLKGVETTLKTMERDRANGNNTTAKGITDKTIISNSNNNNSDGGDGDSEKANILTEMDLVAEVEWLRSVIESEDFPVVFCHNDLQEGNILLRQDYSSTAGGQNYECTTLESFDESTQLDSHFSGILISNGVVPEGHILAPSNGGNINLNRNSRKRSLDQDHMENDLDNTRDSVLSGNSQALSEVPSLTDGEPELMIIDFEYCAYNYRGFDLANHFLEWTFDYTNSESPYFYHKLDQYPSAEQQDQFIRQYLSHLAPAERLSYGDRDSAAEDYDEASDAGSVSDRSSGGSVGTDEINHVRREVQCFTMASHLFWSLWAIVNVYQEIEFGYLEYAICRLNQYRSAKKSYIETANIVDSTRKASSVDPEK